MAADIRVTTSVVLREDELTWRFSRSSGPGGQGVNTTDSRVELSVDLAATSALDEGQRERVFAALEGRLVEGRLTVTASEHRSQLRNRQAAADRLAQVLREALAPPPPRRKATKPTRGSRRRRAEAKTRRSQIKDLRRRPAE